MNCIEEPERDECADDLDIVARCVLVDELIVVFISSIVANIASLCV